MSSTSVVEEKNPRGIPAAPFIADVQEHVGGPDGDVEAALNGIQNALAKYRYMDSNLQHRRKTLGDKIPDIRKTLSMVEFLQERREGNSKAQASKDEEDDLEDELEDDDENPAGPSKPLKTTFELNDTLYAEAELEDTDTVYLWLGANVMLSYKIPDALELLRTKLEAAETGLRNTEEDLEFIREQITIMEVNTARVYNWDVKRRREKRDREGGGSKSDS